MSRGSLILLTLVLVTHLLPGQIVFEHKPPETDLAQGTIGAILQDRQGFMWFGSSDGLNRYDGYEVRMFLHQPEDPFSLSGNTVACLHEDSLGHIWVGTAGGGLSVFDPVYERFRIFKHQADKEHSLSNDYVNCIFEDRAGNIWLGTNGGLNHVDLQSWRFRSFQLDPNDSLTLSNNLINSICQDGGGFYWIGTERGLNRARFPDGPESDMEVVSLGTNKKARTLGGVAVKQVYADPDHADSVIWVATITGLYRISLNPQQEYAIARIRRFLPEADNPNSISEKLVTDILRDRSGTLWIATYGGGLNRLETQKTGDSLNFSFHAIKHERNRAQSLGSDEIWCLYEDRQGIRWIGFEGKGVDKFLPEQKTGFVPYTRKHWNPDDQLANVTTALFRDASNRLWVGTERGGLFSVDESTSKYRTYGPGPSRAHSLAHWTVTTITQDSSGTLWIGTFGGLSRWNPETDNFKSYFHDPENHNSLSNKRIFATYADEDGILWIGTRGGGLNRFDPKTETFTHYRYDPQNPNSINNDHVWLIISDSKGGMWLSTDGGLNHFDPQTQVFRHYKNDPTDPNSLSNNYVNALLLDSKGILWVGTDGSGLNRFDPGTETFIRYRKKDGLPDRVIYGILEDRNGMLWLSTNQGLSRFNPEVPLTSRKFAAFRNYDRRDGLQDNEFNMGAYCKDQAGRLYFGGMKGFNIFDPDSIRSNPIIPEVRITRMRILNEEVSPGEPLKNKRKILEKSLHITETVSLTYRENVISFDFAALNYFQTEDNRFAYQMVGFDEDWVYSGNERRATYTNLDDGDYTFRVKASNNDGLWNETGTSLRISISPPFWKTWWAYLLYGLLFIGSIFAFIRFKIKEKEQELAKEAEIERAKIEERERVRKKSSIDFHDELGNKLTKISLFVELAKRNAPEEGNLGPFLNRIEENAQQLSEGMRDFIWVLDPEKDSLYDTLVRIKDFGDQLFEHTDTLFLAHGIQEQMIDMKLSLDIRRHMVLIFKEAMNNVLKYADCNKIKLVTQLEGEQLSINLTDNGKGFEINQGSNGYGLSNMRERAEKIGAQFELKTKPGAGTSIGIRYKLPQMRD